MRRKALIISVPNAKGEGNLPGAEVDGVHWAKFLHTNNGGAWESGEIELLKNPTIAEVKRHIALMASFDYTLVACSGHGEHVKDGIVSYDTLVLGDGHEIKEPELIPANGKATLVMDTCRNVRIIQKAMKAFGQKIASFAEQRSDYRQQCRMLFDGHVEKCPSGTIRLKSCSVGQSAGEAPMGQGGGYFSDALILPFLEGDGQTLADQTSKRVIDLKDAFDVAYVGVLFRDPNQTPVLEAGRRSTYYPFAVYP